MTSGTILEVQIPRKASSTRLLAASRP
uniref:Uncharacterized protein n=1 Tax=Arundo donax TaxID=35708 RepID=A0A0A8Y2I1_ARUDO